MAEAAAVSALLRMVANSLAPLLERELCFLWGVHSDAMKLETTLSLIQDVMTDAEERSIWERAVHDWLTKLADVAYDADDVLDEFHTETLLRRSALRRGFLVKVSAFFSLSNPLVFRLRMGHKISKIREKLQVIAEERTRYQLKEGIVPEWRINVAERETHSFVAEDEVYGREQDKEKIIDLLINTGHDVDVAVVPIVGMGGMGKTTLAQLVYNDVRVREHFSKRMWAYVSEIFDLKRIIKSIIGSATEAECHLSELDLLQRRLREALSGSTYLLVLDDVWIENQQSWDGLMQLLTKAGSQGSKIIVTTRSNSSAKITSITLPYCLTALSDDQSWMLFKSRAFGAAGGSVNQRLEAIGKEIVGKCGGLPLAAKTLGGLLRSKREEKEWLDVRDSEIWQLPGHESGILSALRLSYSHLPSPVKQCFAYCSLYAKGNTVVMEDLIQLWIAEGFIVSSDYHQQPEDVGQNYVNILLSCSFFEAVERFGKVRIKMHDLVHDLARSVAAERFLCLINVDETKPVPPQCRHLSVYGRRIASTTFEAASKLHSLHMFIDADSGGPVEAVFNDVLPKLSRLRVLKMRFAPIVEVPKSIGELKHLRYINLSNSDIEILPECIGNLQNLTILNLSYCMKLKMLPQAICSLRSLATLDLSDCVQLNQLPERISDLTNLKHLKLKSCFKLAKTPPNIRHLCSIRTLSLFVVGKDHGCGIEELQFLNQLRGELIIKGIQNIKNAANAAQANLKQKQQLQSLILTWNDASVFQENGEGVLEGLQPHPNIEELQIEGYAGVTLPSWIEMPTTHSSFENLVTLHLVGVRRCESLPSLGQLRSLKKLHIGFLMVRHISTEFYGNGGTFPSLEELYLSWMYNLKEWSVVADEEVRVFPRLTNLAVDNCPSLLALPCIPSVVNLELTWSIEELLSSRGSVGRLSPSLKTLDIKSFDEWTMKYLLEQQAPISVETLRIMFCQQLTCLPDDMLPYYFPSIKHLYIFRCWNLVSLGGITEEMKQHLSHSLVTLEISGCRRLSSLPEWLVEVTSLTSLSIANCDALESLPEGFERLTSLQTLSVAKCPDLKKRCEKEKGEDWHKIAQIPHVFFWD